MKTLVLFAHGTTESAQMQKKNIISIFSENCINEYKIIQDGPGVLGTDANGHVETQTENIVTRLAEDAEIQLIVLVGFSRGAVTCLRIANKLDELQQKGTIPKSVRIDIFAIDPVAGLTDKKPDSGRKIPPIVRCYVAILQEHEERRLFVPQDKTRVVVVDSSKTSAVFLPLYGFHSGATCGRGGELFATKNINDSAVILWHLVYEFTISRGVIFKNNQMPPFVIYAEGLTKFYDIAEEASKNIRKDLLDKADRSQLSKVALLECYSRMIENRSYYQEKAQEHNKMPFNLKREFVEKKEQYHLGHSYFINQHHRELFKEIFPALFDYCFQKNEEGFDRNAILADIEKMYHVDKYAFSHIEQLDIGVRLSLELQQEIIEDIKNNPLSLKPIHLTAKDLHVQLPSPKGTHLIEVSRFSDILDNQMYSPESEKNRPLFLLLQLFTDIIQTIEVYQKYNSPQSFAIKQILEELKYLTYNIYIENSSVEIKTLLLKNCLNLAGALVANPKENELICPGSPLHFQCTEYDSHVEYNGIRKPLMIGCSGGGGHIAAINGIKEFLKRNYNNVKFTSYQAVLPSDKDESSARDQINLGTNLMHSRFVGVLMRALIELTYLPVLPEPTQLKNEVAALGEKEQNLPNGMREYVDMLLDAYPAGYESAGIWNVLQKNDRTTELRKLIDLQKTSDTDNYQFVYDYYLALLNKAAEEDEPYTEIISTQAMSLPALCDVVRDYNKNKKPNHPRVIIHQYMTDLPTKGAIHFFNALSALNPRQQQQMKLYGIGMSSAVIRHFMPKGNNFAMLCNIQADQNPMVRPGFKDKSLNKSNKFHEDTTIVLKERSFNIIADEQIASIMLGSQGSNDTVEYIENLLVNGMDKVFVFGGTNPYIKNEIEKILIKHPHYRDKIIPLGNQGDREIAQLMSRSNIIIIRGGGLSVMEQMAMAHSPEQIVLIHHANSPLEELTSGISWEDDNVATLMEWLTENGVLVGKTSPERAKQQVPQFRLIAALKKEQVVDIDSFYQKIKELPHYRLAVLIELLNALKSTDLPFYPFLDAYIYKCTTKEMQKKWFVCLDSSIKSKELNNNLTKLLHPAAHEAFFHHSFLKVNLERLEQHFRDLENKDPSAYAVVREYFLTLLSSIAARNILEFKEILSQENLKTLIENPQTYYLFNVLNSQITVIADLIKLDALISKTALLQMVLPENAALSLPSSNDIKLLPEPDQEQLEVKPHLTSALSGFIKQFENYQREMQKKVDNMTSNNGSIFSIGTLFAKQQISYIRVITSKINIVNHLISQLHSLSDGVMEEQCIAKQVSKFLLKAQQENDALYGETRQEGKLDKFIKVGISFLKIQYSLSFEEGKSEFLREQNTTMLAN